MTPFQLELKLTGSASTVSDVVPVSSAYPNDAEDKHHKSKASACSLIARYIEFS